MRSDNEPLRLLTRIILELELFKKSIRKNKAKCNYQNNRNCQTEIKLCEQALTKF